MYAVCSSGFPYQWHLLFSLPTQVGLQALAMADLELPPSNLHLPSAEIKGSRHHSPFWMTLKGICKNGRSVLVLSEGGTPLSRTWLLKSRGGALQRLPYNVGMVGTHTRSLVRALSRERAALRRVHRLARLAFLCSSVATKLSSVICPPAVGVRELIHLPYPLVLVREVRVILSCVP